MRTYSLSFLFLISSFTIFGQHELKRDSLYNELKGHKETDTAYIEILQTVAKTYSDSLPELMLKLANKTEKLSQKINYKKGVVGSLIIYARYYNKINKPDTSIYILQKARKLADNINDCKTAFKVYSYLNEFCSMHNYNDTVIAYMPEYIWRYKDKDKEKLHIIYNSLAVSFYYLGSLDSSIRYASLGLEFSKKTKDLNGESALLNIMAASLKRKGEIDTAIYYFNQTIDIAKKTNDYQKLVFAYNNIANIYGDRGNNPKALDYYLLSLGVAESNNLENTKAVIYNNIAIVYYTLKDYEETIIYLKKSLDVARNQKHKSSVANALNNIGELYFIQDSLQKSLDAYTEANKIIKQLKAKLLYINNLIGIADVYQKMNKADSAVFYYNKALYLAKQAEASESLAKTYIGLSRFYLNQNNYSKSHDLSNKAMLLAKKLGQVDLIKESAEILHKSNAKLLKYSQAYHFLSIFSKMNDSILSSDNTKEVTMLQMQYEYDKEIQDRETKERLLEIKRQKQIEKEKSLRNIFIVAFISVLITVIQVIRNNRQKQKANQKLEIKKNELEIAHKKITDSIGYAQRIQSALFSVSVDLNQFARESFILHKPLNMVSGDFYWFEKVQNRLLIAVADCTGHGVPGAMMSMLGISYITDLARNKNIITPNSLLNELRNRIKHSLNQESGSVAMEDGMDISFAEINIDTNELFFSGANNSMILFRDGELIEFKGDRQPISIYPIEKPFTCKKTSLKKGDAIYMFSDGFRDQFHGVTKKKYGKARFREFLTKIHTKPMKEQHKLLDKELKEWMNEKTPQIDDILVVGFRW